MTILLWLLVLSFLSVILGFVALLNQKIYLDAQTREATEIDVPILGKMKTNYPSLVFVFLGFAMAVAVLVQHGKTEPVTWKVSGQFLSDDREMQWLAKDLTVFPCGLQIAMNKDTGEFNIELDIEKGKNFEDTIEVITYSAPKASGTIIPGRQMELFDQGDSGSLLKTKGSRLRMYKPAPLEPFQ